MKNKKVIVMLIAGISLILSGLIGNLVISFKKDKTATNARMILTNKEYGNFLEASNKFNMMRDNLYMNVFSEMYYDTIRENINDYYEKLKEYESLVDDTTKAVKELDKYCKNVYYSSAKTNTKCSDYKELYEQVVNCFVYDVTQINDNIKSYNKQQENKENILSEYQHNKKFIDYNKDKKYLGKDGV